MRKALKKHAPTILTSIGGAGVVTTAVMAAKATPKAVLLLEQAEAERGEKLTKFEKVKVAGPVYIPTALMGATTLVCIFGANTLNQRKQAALTSAYGLVNSSYQEYKKKVEELYGKDANNEVTEEIAKDHYERSVVQVDDGKELFYDEFSKRYFVSTVADVQRAEYYINRDLSMREWATLNEFYIYLDLPPIQSGEELGWSTGMNFDYYWQTWIDFTHRKVTMPDGVECHMITILSEPLLDWEEY